MIFHEPLFYIYLVYGLSFLFMSYVVFHGIRNATAITLVSTFYILALFGFTHGLAEIIDWVRFIVNRSGARDISALKYGSAFLATVSFVVLLQFGVNLLTYKSSKKQWLRFLPAVLVIVYLVVLFTAGMNDIFEASLLARRCFGISGALLTSIALVGLSNTMKVLGNSKIVAGLIATAIAFASYAVFAGLIITPIAGLPIQLFRSACAVVIAIASVSVLGVFSVKEQASGASPKIDREVQFQC